MAKNFKSNKAYKSWLAYGHASGEFAKTPGNQKVSIKGNPKKVKHKHGGPHDLPQESDWTTRLNPFNWGVDDYTDKGDFSSAYASAKKTGETEFIWNNVRYATDIPKTNFLNKFIANNIYPYGDILTSKSGFKRDYDEQMKLKYYDNGIYTTDKKLERNDFSKITRNKKGESTYDVYRLKGRSTPPGQPKDLNASYDALSIFNNQPQKYNSFKDSKYKPLDSKNPNAKYYSFNNRYEKQIEDDLLLYDNRDFIDSQEKKRQEENSWVAGAALKNFQY